MPEHEIDRIIEAAAHDSMVHPTMINCERCMGKGYHHGFGEDGADPDWCENCGGGGYVVQQWELSTNVRAALLAAGFVIVPATDALLAKGRESGVTIHD